MAPLVEKTRGTNVAFSTAIILWLYVLFFSISCLWKGSFTAALEAAVGWNILTSKNTLSIGRQTPLADTSNLASAASFVDLSGNCSPVRDKSGGSMTTSSTSIPESSLYILIEKTLESSYRIHSSRVCDEKYKFNTQPGVEIRTDYFIRSVTCRCTFIQSWETISSSSKVGTYTDRSPRADTCCGLESVIRVCMFVLVFLIFFYTVIRVCMEIYDQVAGSYFDPCTTEI